MNKNKWMRINNTLRNRKIHHDQAKHINCVRFHPKESFKQRMKKCEIASKLYSDGIPFLTEVWTADRKKRFDILDLENDIDYEITTDIKKELKKIYKGDKIVKI